jgi:hypothetical protein
MSVDTVDNPASVVSISSRTTAARVISSPARTSPTSAWVGPAPGKTPGKTLGKRRCAAARTWCQKKTDISKSNFLKKFRNE